MIYRLMIVPGEPVITAKGVRINSGAGFPMIHDNLFISRLALQMDLVLMVLY
uniref:Uncharacterized protein n=1 Tax=Candidatus Kentrum sp. SD TaxID=2126332 RepID=A0A451BHX6_9GAMM|nr:MAG: hypothetical protein BECKSD772D_GA0070982_100350 [Candidatus Kentron sp. SD]